MSALRLNTDGRLGSRTSKLPTAMVKKSFQDDFARYQSAKRCRPAQDLGAGLVGGASVGGVGGGVVGMLALGVPLLPVFGLGFVTGIVGGAAGGVLGGALGGVVGGVGGGITAACHAHIHAPEPRKLRKHVFSNFGVVSMRHHSSRIVQHLQNAGVLSVGGSRLVQRTNGVDNALRGVRISGKPLTSAQTQAIKQIVQLQASRT